MSPNRRKLSHLIAVAALISTVAACGSDKDTETKAAGGDSAGADVVAAAEKAAEANTTIDKIGPTKPVSGKVPAGKKIVWVNCGQPACAAQGVALKDAAQVNKWVFEEIVTQPTPEAVQAAFDEALRRKPDYVASAGLGADLYPQQLKKLNDAGAKVMSITGNEESGEKGIAFEALGPKGASDALRVLANKTIADVGGKGQIGSVMLGGFPIVKTYTEAYEDEITTKCPDCEVARLDIQPTALGKDAADQIANFIRRNPEMKAILYSYDLMGIGVPAAASGAGVTDLPKSYSWAPDAPGLDALREGERTASMLMPHNELAWMVMDAAVRDAAGDSLEGSTPTQPVQIIGKDYDNVPTTTEPYPASVKDYREQFMELWGVK